MSGTLTLRQRLAPKFGIMAAVATMARAGKRDTDLSVLQVSFCMQHEAPSIIFLMHPILLDVFCLLLSLDGTRTVLLHSSS